MVSGLERFHCIHTLYTYTSPVLLHQNKPSSFLVALLQSFPLSHMYESQQELLEDYTFAHVASRNRQVLTKFWAAFAERTTSASTYRLSDEQLRTSAESTPSLLASVECRGVSRRSLSLHFLLLQNDKNQLHA